ncbi:hypothetical protein FACS1894130_05170 [Spirochaetia bacterium]|nr:hypothetical protein FACS1894130_05170 [Spirochaetia bacterium]
MADCSAEFKDFLDSIQLGKTNVDNLRRSRDAIKDKVIGYYQDKGLASPAFCGQGSFKVKTGIRQSGEDYDIDHGVYLQHLPDAKDDWPKAETVHDEIMDAVNDHTNTPPKDKHACVRVQYKKEYHVDLAIYGEDRDGKIYLARKGSGQWEENNPKLFTAWFLDKLKIHGEQMRSVVKYIKKWSYYNGWMDSISGFFITILVGNHFSAVPDRDDAALKNTLSGIVSYLQVNRRIIRPVVPAVNLTESFSEDAMDAMISHFRDFKNEAEKAIFGTSKEDAQQTWQKLFGNEFPKYKETQKDYSSVTVIQRENKPWGN